jgi:hypothetical protein
VTAAATFVVAIVVALAVPISQLRTVDIVKSCCCPDPARCHCPDHQPGDDSDQPGMRACHQSQQVTIAPQLPSFVAPATIVNDAPMRVVAVASIALPEPHPAPSPARPAAPS